MLTSIQNFVKSIYIQERFTSLCYGPMYPKNDNHFKKSHSIILLGYTHRLMGQQNIYYL